MGMYTGLRFKAVIKEEYRPVIKKMMDDQLNWEELIKVFPWFTIAEALSTSFRGTSIPYGGLAYMPDSWEVLREDHEKYEYSWDKRMDHPEFERKFDEETGIWQFQCSLKNYESDIELFLNTVAPAIVQEVIHIESHYEESSYGYLYILQDGKLIEDPNNRMIYDEDEENYSE